MKKPRFRNVFMVGGSIIILAYLLYSDPSEGSLTLTFLAQLATPVIAVLFAHLARKALFDYLDMGTLYEKAKESATGSGLTFAGICIVIAALLGMFGSKVYAQSVTTYVPPAAIAQMPVLKQEASTYYPEHPKPISLLA